MEQGRQRRETGILAGYEGEQKVFSYIVCFLIPLFLIFSMKKLREGSAWGDLIDTLCNPA